MTAGKPKNPPPLPWDDPAGYKPYKPKLSWRTRLHWWRFSHGLLATQMYERYPLLRRLWPPCRGCGDPRGYCACKYLDEDPLH